MTTVQIPSNTTLGKAISRAAEAYDLDPNAFASGLLNAVLHKKAPSPAPAPAAPAPAPSTTTPPDTRHE